MCGKVVKDSVSAGLSDNIDFSGLRAKLTNVSFFKNGYAVLFDSRGVALIHPTDEGKNLTNTTYCSKIITERKPADCFKYIDDISRTPKVICFKYYKQIDVYIAIIVEQKDYLMSFVSFLVFYLIISLIVFGIIGYVAFRIIDYYSSILTESKQIMANIERGNYKVSYNLLNEETEKMNLKLNSFSGYMESIHLFAKELSEGKLDATCNVASDKTELPVFLNSIRNNIKAAKEAEEKRKIDDEKQNWVNQGLAKFGELLRTHTDNLEAHCDNIIQNIVKYINANQGGLFLINRDDKENQHIELISAFAYGTKKFLKKTYAEGEGLIGTCVLEKGTIYVTDVPNEYLEITSGLGEANPRSLLICPIKNEEDVLGVVELASFSQFEPHVIKFVEKILESVAATLKSAKINEQTSDLLRKFELHKKEMAENEEMMKQTIEEFKATEEESQFKEIIFTNYVKSLTDNLIFVEYGNSGHVSYANENFVSLIGKENKQLAMTNLKDHLHLKFAQVKELGSLMDDLNNNKKHETTNQYEFNGKNVWLKETYIPVKNGFDKLEKFLRVCVDITVQKKNEETILILNQQVEELNKLKLELLNKIDKNEKQL